ncbi:MAG: YjbE family putative metal transport protein [Candidatus Niyogibacteria bacterium]|nr:YjbE family putative metal transport protein [Candidatus Niyogibacteria bacterium]
MGELWALLQIVMIDIVMAGDNAIVVGMFAASVPKEDRKKVILWGTAVAVILRIAFATIAVQLLAIVGLTLAGGLLLGYVCYGMYTDLRKGGHEEAAEVVHAVAHRSAPRAVWGIALADVSMSLDNVLAVAGAAQGHMGMLVVGLLISVVLMAVAASWIARLIHRHHWIGWIGFIVVAYVAIMMIWHGSHEVAAVVM